MKNLLSIITLSFLILSSCSKKEDVNPSASLFDQIKGKYTAVELFSDGLTLTLPSAVVDASGTAEIYENAQGKKMFLMSMEIATVVQEMDFPLIEENLEKSGQKIYLMKADGSEIYVEGNNLYFSSIDEDGNNKVTFRKNS